MTSPVTPHPHGTSRSRDRRRSLAAIGAAALVAGAALAAPGAASAATTDDTPAPQNMVYVEVNDNDLANVADYTLKGTNRPAFDMAAIFAANINYDGSKAYLHLNERVTWTLENADTQIRPLQAKGTKVLLSVLGNHQGAGFANFTTPAAADAFAAELEDAVETYDLDGIDFDDEWVKYGVNGTAQPNKQSFGWLLEALDERLDDDKILSLYNIGPTAFTTDFTAIDTTHLLDYVWNPYYGTYSPPTTPGMTSAQKGAAAVEINRTSATRAADYARRTVADGYGVYVTYNLKNVDSSAYLSNITQAFHGLDTVYKQAPVDDVAPAAEVATGGANTALHGQGPSYNKVSFHVTDDGGPATGGIASITLNDTVTTYAGETAVTFGVIKPGIGGAVRGENTLTVTDLAGNTTTTTFSLK